MIRSQLAEFKRRMQPNSVAIIPAAREATRSNDTNYRFRQDSDFFYLTGFEEPEAIAIVKPGETHEYVLFVRPRDPEREIWDGRRAGVEGAKSEFGAEEALPIDEFDSKLTEILDNAETLYYRLGVNRELDDKIIHEISRMRSLNRKPIHPPQTIVDPATIIHELRVIKSPQELEIMQTAADIAAEAHCEAMKAVRAGMQEFEVEALIEQIFRRRGAAGPAYTSIVGAGPNATVLHYINNDAQLHDGDLLLVDAGAEYKGYASDITRTFPINGRYSKPQREIYDLVLKAQMSCVEMVRPGVTHDQLKAISHDVGPDRTLLICCKAFNARLDDFENLTVKKIPHAILNRCEWGQNDYSLEIANLPPREPDGGNDSSDHSNGEAPTGRKRGRGKTADSQPNLFSEGEA